MSDMCGIKRLFEVIFQATLFFYANSIKKHVP